MEFYEALVAVLTAMPGGSTVSDAIASEAGQRVRTKWQLKYGRQARLQATRIDPRVASGIGAPRSPGKGTPLELGMVRD